MRRNSTIGIDLGKRAVQVFGDGKLKRRLRRVEVLPFFAKVERRIIGIEACSGAHYWGRELTKLGHEVKLMPPQYVKPYVKRNKNDDQDAEACWEAVQRPNMRFVPIKSPEQQAVLQLHCERERLVRERTKVVNQVGGFLLEFGIVFPKSVNKFVQNVQEVLELHAENIPSLSARLIARCLDDFLRLCDRIDDCERLIKSQLNDDPVCQQLDTIPGIGMIIATATRASVVDVTKFKNGRHFSASLGLVPQQNSSGQTTRLGRMSKRGNPYLRKLLIQGAHAVLNTIARKHDPHSRWLKELVKRRGRCKAAVALANKNARIIYAILAAKSNKFSAAQAHNQFRQSELRLAA